MYQYYIYGLGIHTEIRFYNLEEKSVSGDVLVHYGVISREIEEYMRKGLTSAMSAERVWFRNENAHFVISGGNDIMVQPIQNVTDEEIASFVLGWGMAFLFQLRGVSAIHSSAIEIQGRAVLIAGFSGSGKSTTALSLLAAGCRYLTDDITMVDPRHDFMIQPSYPQQKLCRNVAEQMKKADLYYIDEKKDKFAYLNRKDFCGEPRKLTTMFILDPYDGQRVVVKEVKGIDKLNCILKNLFLLDAYRSLGFTIEEQIRCLKIAEKINVFKISRPKDRDTTEEVRNIILAMGERLCQLSGEQ